MNERYSFTRYLAAKRSVDDRALNRLVSGALARALAGMANPTVLEIGAGIGTMVERLHEWQILSAGTQYTAIDARAENIDNARQRLQALEDVYKLRLETIDLFDFIAREQGQRTWDLLIAHAFLDLVDLESTLPQLLSLLKPGGYFYFTINFDGETTLQPVIDRQFDDQIMALYHETMDTRGTNGRRSGDSRTGRRLFTHLPLLGAEILEAGSSDWVVYPAAGGYEGDEAYFLHAIIDMIAGALEGTPGLDRSYFAAWVAQRHAQINAGVLVYIAHQLDFFGRLAP